MFIDGIRLVIDSVYWAAEFLPLSVFIFLGAMLEEIIAPIPSPLVMTLSGTLAAAKNYPFIYLVGLIFLSVIGKTIGSFIVYVIGDKGGDLMVKKFGKFFKISAKEIEEVSVYLNKGWKDSLSIFLLRAIPIIPTSPVSIICGLIKINLNVYLIFTALGTLVRSGFYFYLGYMGMGALESIDNMAGIGKIGYAIIFVLVIIFFFGVYFYAKRQKDKILKK